MANDRDVKRQALQLYLVGIDIDKIVEIVGKSQRTIYRYIKEYEEGKCDIDLSNVVTNVKKFQEKEFNDLLDVLSSKIYIDKITMALDKIDDQQIENELKKNGIRGVTGFIGTLVDKRLKSYTVILEKENLKLKKQVASNSRVVQFVGEEPVYEIDHQLQNDDTQSIS